MYTYIYIVFSFTIHKTCEQSIFSVSVWEMATRGETDRPGGEWCQARCFDRLVSTGCRNKRLRVVAWLTIDMSLS